MNPSQSDFEKLQAKLNYHVMQSWLWAQSRENHAPFIVDDVPFVARFSKSKLLRTPYAVLQRVGTHTTDFNSWSPHVQKLLHDSYRCQWVTFEPHVVLPSSSNRTHTVVSTHLETVMVDLDKPESELFSQLSRTYRKYYRQIERKGAQIEFYTEGDAALEKFIDFSKTIETSKKFIPVPETYYRQTWKTFSTEGRAYIALVTLEQEPVAAYMCVLNNNTAYQFYGGATKEGRVSHASIFLSYQSLLQAKRMGCTLYDMWGAAPFDANQNLLENHELSGISRFKLGFGGRLVAFAPPFTLASNRMLFAVYTLEQKLLKIVKWIRKR